MSKVKKATLVIVLTVAISVVIFFAFYLYHVMVYLKPEPLKIRIINEDNRDHSINIKIFYKNNEIYNKSFNLKSKDKVSTGEISKEKGTYEIIVTLDNKIKKIFTAKVGFSYSSVDMFIVNKSGKMRIEIYQAVY